MAGIAAISMRFAAHIASITLATCFMGASLSSFAPTVGAGVIFAIHKVAIFDGNYVPAEVH